MRAEARILDVTDLLRIDPADDLAIGGLASLPDDCSSQLREVLAAAAAPGFAHELADEASVRRAFGQESSGWRRPHLGRRFAVAIGVAAALSIVGVSTCLAAADVPNPASGIVHSMFGAISPPSATPSRAEAPARASTTSAASAASPPPSTVRFGCWNRTEGLAASGSAANSRCVVVRRSHSSLPTTSALVPAPSISGSGKPLGTGLTNSGGSGGSVSGKSGSGSSGGGGSGGGSSGGSGSSGGGGGSSRGGFGGTGGGHKCKSGGGSTTTTTTTTTTSTTTTTTTSTTTTTTPTTTTTTTPTTTLPDGSTGSKATCGGSDSGSGSPTSG